MVQNLEIGYGAYSYEPCYAGKYTLDGAIEGKIPQYIYNTEMKKFMAVTNLAGTFYMNKNLKIAPEIPSTVDYMGYTFYGCENLEKASVIPKNVSNVERTFYKCSKLEETPKILSNEITQMFQTFSNCNNLKKITNIPGGMRWSSIICRRRFSKLFEKY